MSDKFLHEWEGQMSQNDVIYLLKVKDHYEIVHADADSANVYSKVIAKTPLQALKKAQEMQDSTGAEYGVMIDICEKRKPSVKN
jgi:hypothetical protein